jgi:predicted nucleotide-binding protein (sugar kinase/HSP70/actin superfamily)
MVCLPFKVTLGDMFACLENGADTLAFIGGGDWSCRFGYYGRIQCSILAGCGFQFRKIFVGPRDIRSIVSRILKLNHMSWTMTVKNALRGAAIAYHKSKLLELTETLARETRPVACLPHSVTKLETDFLEEIDHTSTIHGLATLKNDVRNAFSGVDTEPKKDILRIMLVGESYCVIEPFVNFGLIERLGSMQVYVEPFLTAHRWLFSHLLRKEENRYLSKKRAQQLAHPFWHYGAGGEDQVSIGHVIFAAEHSFDGIIHLMPFGCMPETAALPVFESLSKHYNIPFLNFSLDEHSSPEGFYTRIEAFLDCLRLRRDKQAA